MDGQIRDARVIKLNIATATEGQHSIPRFILVQSAQDAHGR